MGFDLWKWLESLEARRINGSGAASAITLSLPLPSGGGVPEENGVSPVFGGIATQGRPLGEWPGGAVGDGGVRRFLLSACVESAPERIGLRRGVAETGSFEGPAARIAILAANHDRVAPYEINELVLDGGNAELGVRVGLQTGEGLHWWQWVRLEVLHEGPVCREIRALGAIPVHFDRPGDEPEEGMPFSHPSAHRHNHVRGEIFARCFRNGVIDLRVRHINGTFFSEGGDVEDAVPVIGFRAKGLPPDDLPGEVTAAMRWAGSKVAIDTTPAATLVGPERPGRAWRADGCLVYQPYTGVEPKAGKPAAIIRGDHFLARAGQRRIPRGAARTVGFRCSLGEAEPEIATYLVPDWWYGATGELFLEPLLPVRDRFHVTFERAVEYFFKRAHTHCFDDGAVGRSDRLPEEPGWEGETAFGQMLAAYHTGDADVYDLALRSCYHLADVATDHVLHSVRMHGYGPPAMSLSMQRVGGMVSGFLETGDPWFLETAEAVADRAWHWDTGHWPRRSIGRDASYIRSLLAIYRCTGNELYRLRAREAIGRVMATQLPDGSYRQQGGTVGIHSHVNLTIKPWMGCAATEAIVDYLFLAEETELETAVLRFADWLLDHKVACGDATFWPYFYSHGDGETASEADRNARTREPWHVEYLGLILGWAAVRTGNADYYRAWEDSWSRYAASRVTWDHGATKVIQHLAWLRARLAGGRIGWEGLTRSPLPEISPAAEEAAIRAPVPPGKAAPGVRSG